MTNDGKSPGSGKVVKLKGEVKPNDKGLCYVNVTKIENP